jgi:hypothetical protein
VTRLALRRGRVASVEVGGPAARVTVEHGGGERRPALALTDLVGAVEAGDDVVVNVTALDLGLGSGGFDVVHVNLTRGLAAPVVTGGALKLNYSSLQHAVEPVEARRGHALPVGPLDRPVGALMLHGQLAPVAWALARRAPGARVGYVQTAGGALPGALSDTVRELRRRGLLAGHVTAGPCFGGEEEALTVAGALHAGLGAGGWDVALAGPGPGIQGSESALGHGGLATLDSLHAAIALGCRAVLVPRMSSGDPRPRHRGVSHHTRTVLDLLLRPVGVAVPPGSEGEIPSPHEARRAVVDLQDYAEARLPVRTMGRDIGDDPLFFKAALAGGGVLAEEMHGL